MVSVIGIDSRKFERTNLRRNGKLGTFSSIIGIAIKVNDYYTYDQDYKEAIGRAFDDIKEEIDYSYYCYNDIKDHPKRYELLNSFVKNISDKIEKVHVFYSLFSQKEIPEIKVYGRMAKRKGLKLSNPTRSLDEFISEHLTNTFPAICAWRISEYFTPDTVEFHLDSYSGHIFEAQEELDKSEYCISIIPNGDCSNPVISTADLLLEVLDRRLEIKRLRLLFENIRPVFKEFGEKVLVYPITNKHLPKITPIDNKPIDVTQNIKHPVYWLFKGDALIDSGTLKRSKTYRNLVDYMASRNGTVKLFDKSRDIKQYVDGDYGVFINPQGKETIKTYQNIGKNFIPFDFNVMVPKEYSSE